MTTRQIVTRFFEPVKIYPTPFFKAMVQSSLWGLFDIYLILLFEYVANRIQDSGFDDVYTTILIQFLIVLCVFTGIKALMRHWGRTEMYQPYQIIIGKIYFPRFFTLDFTYTEKYGVGRAINIIKVGIEERVKMFTEIVYTVPGFLIKILFTVYFVFRLGVEYGLLFIVLLIVLNWVVIVLNNKTIKRREKRKIREIEKSRQEIHMLMAKQEILQSDNIIKEIDKYETISMKLQSVEKIVNNYVWSMFNIPMFFVGLVNATALAYVAFYIGDQTFSFGTYTALVALSGFLTSSLIHSTESFKNMGKMQTHIASLRNFLDNGKTIQGYTEGKIFAYGSGSIRVENVTFGYDQDDHQTEKTEQMTDTPQYVFENFSLTIEGSKKTALVGASGSGKSTLVKLIAGYLRPDKGSIIVDDQNLSEVALKYYYQHIGYLTQDPSVFDGTIRENLEYGIRQSAVNSNEQQSIESVIRLAKCEWIYDLPNGLDTEIGERGVRLSGGQRQRLAIAKIMLKDPQIIILDEPTSALDSFAEEAITEAMNNLFKGRTVIIIAHRLQTVKHADDIIVFEQGKIIERGTHNALVKKGGSYARMLELQAGF